MRRFAVLGNPIEHSKSPEIHRAFAESCRHEIDYQKVLVEAGDFDRVVTEFFASGGIGLNVTAPFKGEAFALAEVHTEDAVDAKAVNTLWRDDEGRVCGHTTDGSGLARDLEVNLGWRLAGVNILFLGAGGKMGPTMARMARRAADLAETERRIIAVSRFSDPALPERLQSWNVEPVSCDLTDEDAVKRLPDAPNVVYLAGTKFGTGGNEPRTWAMNTWLPERRKGT